jgi:hypothetical protein
MRQHRSIGRGLAGRRGVLLVVAVVGLSCTADGSVPPPGASDGSEAPTDPSEASAAARILFSRIMKSDEIRYFVVGVDGTGETPFAPGKEFEGRQLSPDGSQLAIVGPNEDGLLVGGTVGVDGNGYRLFAAPDPALNLACGVWAPDDRMACEGWDDTDPSRTGIYSVRASDGSDPRRLTRHRDVPCDYSPDGMQLAFMRTGRDAAVGTLMLMDAGGGKARALLDDIELTGLPCDWSPDGRSILVTRDGALVVVAPDGGWSPIEGEGLDGFSLGAVWSPDGSHVLFAMTLESDDFDVYSVAADGTDLTRIADSELLEEPANWLP